jgi:hypothetical protein
MQLIQIFKSKFWNDLPVTCTSKEREMCDYGANGKYHNCGFMGSKL